MPARAVPAWTALSRRSCASMLTAVHGGQPMLGTCHLRRPGRLHCEQMYRRGIRRVPPSHRVHDDVLVRHVEMDRSRRGRHGAVEVDTSRYVVETSYAAPRRRVTMRVRRVPSVVRRDGRLRDANCRSQRSAARAVTASASSAPCRWLSRRSAPCRSPDGNARSSAVSKPKTSPFVAARARPGAAERPARAVERQDVARRRRRRVEGRAAEARHDGRGGRAREVAADGRRGAVRRGRRRDLHADWLAG